MNDDLISRLIDEWYYHVDEHVKHKLDSFARALLSASKPAATGQTDAEALHDAWQTTFDHMNAQKPAAPSPAQTERGALDVADWIEETCRNYCIPRPFAIMETLARAALQAAPATEKSAEPVYAYIYEYETAFGLHRQLEPGTFNGADPTRTVKVYAAPQPAADAPGMAEPVATPIGKVLSDAEMFEARMDGKSGNVIWFGAPQPGYIYAAPQPSPTAVVLDERS